jgi:hypothetical protein
LEAEVSFDTQMEIGDCVVFDDGRKFLVMNLSPEQFENADILFSSVLYRTNIDANIWRSSGEDWDANYLKTSQWTPVTLNEPILITESLYGHDLETDEELAQFGLEKHEAYAPSYLGIEALDRIEYVSGEFYKVEVVKTRRYDGVDVLELAEDTRL